MKNGGQYFQNDSSQSCFQLLLMEKMILHIDKVKGDTDD